MRNTANLWKAGLCLAILTCPDAFLWPGLSARLSSINKPPVPPGNPSQVSYSAQKPSKKYHPNPYPQEPDFPANNQEDIGDENAIPYSYTSRSSRTDKYLYPVGWAALPQSQCICNCNNYNEPDVSEGDYCEWKMVFKAVQGNGRNVYDDWTRSGGINEGVESAKDILSELPYKDGSVIDNWNKLYVKRAKIEVFKRGGRETFFYFDATASSPLSWMHTYRYAASQYFDPVAEGLYYSSVTGEGSGSRFEIAVTIDTCTNMCGYLMVLDTDHSVCDFEDLGTPPHFLYSSDPFECARWGLGSDVAEGDRLVVSLKICDLDL